jgi:hypothetical protein
LAEIGATPEEELSEAMQKAADGLEAVEITVDADLLASLYVRGMTMSAGSKVIDIHKEFPGDEALQDAAKRKGLTLGEYVRSLKIPRTSGTVR